MELALKIIVAYFCLGIIILLMFDLTTKRIRQNFREAMDEARSRFANSGTFIGYKLAYVFLAVAMLIFWWAVLYGAMIKPEEEKGEKNE